MDNNVIANGLSNKLEKYQKVACKLWPVSSFDHRQFFRFKYVVQYYWRELSWSGLLHELKVSI